jgi:hypothetical protein
MGHNSIACYDRGGYLVHRLTNFDVEQLVMICAIST